MQINETILLIITTVITAISALFCIISLATSRWAVIYGLFCTGCPTTSAALSIIAFILLMIAIIVLILLIIRLLPKPIRILSFIVLFLGTIFTLASYAAYFDAGTGYSYKLMVVSHFLCYVASLLIAFWLGGSYGTTIAPAN
ncbi:unnamed protein product [Rotaria sp. Silwood2]|nr:unnamed protein product [Rotaria sp. Silwood2]CAF3157845.1 unnamed protein product [Rotaria sp. Silwood2]CAF4022880.1 unnamed protein product [Rotaria sp. Silwood2]CAF4331476.1 unnamed protein product [Rotaria sp. Silwood2]